MAWKYSQSTGKLINPAGSCVGYGYSGHGVGLDNPAQQAVADVGPIPAGQYEIGSFFDDPEKGPIVARLTPLPGTDTHGRDGFMIHGDNEAIDHSASHGCVILPRVVREQVMASNDRTLTVTV
jgi:hypothetical protein